MHIEIGVIDIVFGLMNICNWVMNIKTRVIDIFYRKLASYRQLAYSATTPKTQLYA